MTTEGYKSNSSSNFSKVSCSSILTVYWCFLKYLQPYGFDVGQSERGSVLKGLDLGVEGMKVGGQVR